MQEFRKYALVVCLTTTMVFATALTAAPVDATHRHGSLGDGIFVRLLAFFGIVLHSRTSIPPGAPEESQSRVSIPPGGIEPESRLSTPPG